MGTTTAFRDIFVLQYVFDKAIVELEKAAFKTKNVIHSSILYDWMSSLKIHGYAPKSNIIMKYAIFVNFLICYF